MDVTPQMLHEVEFRTKKVGGFDPDEVDDFLERVAVGVAELHQRLQDAQQRAAVAEARASAAEARVAELSAQGASATDADDVLRRTLVLAQRTADAAVREAEEQATRIVAVAKERAATEVRDAEARSARLVTDARSEAAKGADDARRRLADDIAVLEDVRERVQSDISLLDRHVDEQRQRLRGVATDLQKLADAGAALRPVPAPELSGVRLPDSFRVEEPEVPGPGGFVADEPIVDESPAAAEPEPEPVPEIAFEPIADPVIDLVAEPDFAVESDVEPAVEPEPDAAFAPEVAPEPEPETIEPEPAFAGPPTAAVDLTDDDAPLSVFPQADRADALDDELPPVSTGTVMDEWPADDDVAGSPDATDEGGPRRGLGLFDALSDEFDGLPVDQQAVHIWSDDPSDGPPGENDAYLSELRKAILDDPNGDEGDGQDGDDNGGGRFRSRFGRKR